MPLHRGPHPPPNTVSLHRATQHFAYRESHARACSFRSLPVKNREIPRKMLPAFFVDCLKICVFEQSQTLRELLQRLGVIIAHSSPDLRPALAGAFNHGNRVLLKPVCVLSRGGVIAQPARLSSSSWFENRASWNGADG